MILMQYAKYDFMQNEFQPTRSQIEPNMPKLTRTQNSSLGGVWENLIKCLENSKGFFTLLYPPVTERDMLVMC